MTLSAAGRSLAWAATVDAPATFPITSKGQVTLPKALRQQLGLGRGSRMSFELVGDQIELRKKIQRFTVRGSVSAGAALPGDGDRRSGEHSGGKPKTMKTLGQSGPMASIQLISIGSRGDLEPYLALLEELQQRGHSVHLIGSPNFQQAAADAGIRFTTLPGDFRELLGSPAGLELLEGKAVRLIDDERLSRWLEIGREAIRGCDLLLAAPLALWAYHLAEAEGCRFGVVSPIPVVGTRAFPFLKWPGDPEHRRWRGRLHQFSYEAVRLLGWRRDAKVIQAFRHRQGLPRLPWRGTKARRNTPQQLQSPTVLHLFNRHLLARPDDWPATARITGYCLRTRTTAESYRPPSDLQRFLEEGPAPIYAGFGSMIPRNPHQLAAVLVDAAQQANQRLILSPGWGRVLPPSALPPSVFVLEECPHSWLFPQLEAAVHHGGAGTTASTLCSGLPSTVVAFFADQPAWGRTLEQLGVSPATHRATTVTAEALSASLRTIATNPRFRQRAKALRDLIRSDNGTAATADAVEELL